MTTDTNTVATSRQDRINIVNGIIGEISRRGRKFFHDEDSGYTSQIFERDKRLFYVDHYTRKEIYLHQPKYRSWSGFSNGGTMRALLMDMKEFIMTGECTNHNNGYGGLYCPHWGYPEEDMKAIQEYAKSVGYLEK